MQTFTILLPISKCIIYNRVSSENNVSGLENQEAICREYATTKAYEVVQVFKDIASGSTLENREGLNQLFAYLKENTDKKFIVLVADTKRLARDMQIYSEIKSELSKYEATLEIADLRSSTIQSELVKTITIALDHLQKEQRKSYLKSRRQKKLENV